jgi:GDP-4-dehydro-6-deoxy-D-mannose reductase
MRVLITGASGFSGRALYKNLSEKKSCELFTSDMVSTAKLNNYTHCDLLDQGNVNALLLKVKPDVIYHLAGTFSNDYERDYAANVSVPKNILESVKEVAKECRVMLIGSAAEYGIVENSENPIKETRTLRPASVYGLTKVYQTYLMKYYVNAFDLDIIMARPFNFYGEGMSETQFVGRVYRQIRALKKGEIKKITVGNLDSGRDYIPIDDTVSHYITIMERGKKGEIYNVGYGVPMRTGVLLNKILDEENIDDKFIEIAKSERDNIYDVSQVYADINKLEELG